MNFSKFEPEFSINNDITFSITEIERARGFLEAAQLSDKWVHEVGRDALIREAHYTTHIEGTQLTLTQAQQLWDGADVPEIDPDDARELLNYRSAFDYVSESIQNDDPISEGMIREIHRHLVNGVRGEQAAPGEYRRIQNYVANSKTKEVIYTPPGALQVPVLMSELVKWLNMETKVHPILMSGIAQFQLVHIHPFLDGNGRTARLLSTLCLYKFGYDFKRLFSISEFYDRDRLEYYKAIQSVRNNEMDMTNWLEYFTKGLCTQMLEVKADGQRVITRDIIVDRHNLNERQGKAFEFIQKNGKLSIKDFETLCPNVNRRSLQRDIKVLLKLNLISEHSTGPTDPTRHYQLHHSLL